MESERRLYLFDGETYIIVPESAWLNEIRTHPTGITVIKSAEEPFLVKSWVKVKQTFDSNSYASETEWLCPETGARLVVAVSKDGQLSVNGKKVGSTTSGETYRVIEKTVSEASKHSAKANADGFEAGKDARKPEAVTVIREKSMYDISRNATRDAMSQLINKYDLPTLECATTVEDVIRNCNAMLQLLEKEQNPAERKRLAELIEKHLALGEKLKTARGNR